MCATKGSYVYYIELVNSSKGNSIENEDKNR